MSKRAKKDIKDMSTGLTEIGNSSDAPVAALLVPTLTIGGDDTKTESRKRSVHSTKSAFVAVSDSAAEDDLDLQGLLAQVDRMLTEMTQSKWLSSEWPKLEIDLGPIRTSNNK